MLFDEFPAGNETKVIESSSVFLFPYDMTKNKVMHNQVDCLIKDDLLETKLN